MTNDKLPRGVVNDERVFPRRVDDRGGARTGAPDVRGPRDVAALRVYLLSEWLPGGVFAESMRVMRAERGHDFNTMPVRDVEVRPVDEWEQRTLTNASLWWVSPEMCDLVLAAEKTLPDDTRLEPELMPSESGLVVFAKPMFGIDADGSDVPVRVDAIAWGPCFLPPLTDDDAETMRTALHDRGAHTFEFEDSEAAVAQRMREPSAYPGGVAIGLSSYHYGNADAGFTKDELENAIRTGAIDQLRVGHVREDRGRDAVSMRLHGGMWAPIGRADWVLDKPVDDRHAPFTDVQLASMVEDRRRMAALWLLMTQQGLATLEVERASRAERRREERAGRTPAPVTVVDVRRHAPSAKSEPGGEGRHLSVRFIVEGHWRRQAYGPKRQYRRPTWIAPHWRGPEDAPLHVPDRVHAFRSYTPPDGE